MFPSPATAAPPPNIVTIMLDDLDAAVLDDAVARGMMPVLEQTFIDTGIEFRNTFVPTPLCSPSRATFLTGQYPHNHGVLRNNSPTGGCASFKDASALGPWLQQSGYRTGLVGKYMNGYGSGQGEASCNGPNYVPPGWNDWQALTGTLSMYNYAINDNGAIVPYGSKPADFQTDVIAARAGNFILESGAQPFFLLVAPYAVHLEDKTPVVCTTNIGSYHDTPAAPRHEGSAASMLLPRTNAFNEPNISDKPSWLRAQVPKQLNASQISCQDTIFEDALESLKSVDDLVGTVLNSLAATGQLGRTILIFTSDNGFLRGEHRLADKRYPYEESARVPLYVHHPQYSIPRSEPAFVVTTDLAPTILQLGGAAATSILDGRSLVPFIQGTPPSTWRKRVLIEHTKDSGSWVPTYSAVRTNSADTSVGDLMYSEYSDGSRELYDLVLDPFEAKSVHDKSSRQAQVNTLKLRLSALRTCGNGNCQASED